MTAPLVYSTSAPATVTAAVIGFGGIVATFTAGVRWLRTALHVGVDDEDPLRLGG